MNWKKTVDWITFMLNMLVALPFIGFISAGIVGLTFYIIFPRTDVSGWFWIPAVILDIILIILWGKYQYRILVLKNPRPPNETIKSLLFLVGFIAAVILLIFGRLWAERMERDQEFEQKQKIQEQQIKELQLEKPK